MHYIATPSCFVPLSIQIAEGDRCKLGCSRQPAFQQGLVSTFSCCCVHVLGLKIGVLCMHSLGIFMME
jgi:hypothetical protein